MFGIKNGNRFVSVIKKGASGVREAYRKQKQALEERARQREKVAKTKMENISIEADLKLEKLKLEREMYEALAAVKREKVAVAKAKKEAGVVGIGERAMLAGKRFYKGLVAKPKRRSKTTKKR